MRVTLTELRKMIKEELSRVQAKGSNMTFNQFRVHIAELLKQIDPAGLEHIISELEEVDFTGGAIHALEESWYTLQSALGDINMDRDTMNPQDFDDEVANATATATYVGVHDVLEASANKFNYEPGQAAQNVPRSKFNEIALAAAQLVDPQFIE